MASAQRYLYGLLVAYGLPIGLFQLVEAWTRPKPSVWLWFDVVSAMTLVSCGLAAALVNPWGWYVLVATYLLTPIWSAAYLGLSDAIVPALKLVLFTLALISSALGAVYFYKRRAMFGATWRWQWLECRVPRLVGPETYDGPSPAIHQLSRSRKLLYASALFLLPLIPLLDRLDNATEHEPLVGEVAPAKTMVSEAPAEASAQPPTVRVRRSREGFEEVLVFQRAQSLYFNNRAGQCYRFEVPGHWGWGGEVGLLSDTGGNGILGVALVLPADLVGIDGPSLLARSAARMAAVYRDVHGRPVRHELIPLQGSRFHAMRWEASWSMDDTAKTVGRAVKVFAELAPTVIAQVSVAAPEADRLFRHLLETLGTTAGADCYWPELRRRYPGMMPASEPSATR